jgi:hypothetical protein
MGRKPKVQPAVPRLPAEPLVVHVIDPNAIYFRDTLTRALRVRAHTLRGALRKGVLRHAVLGGRHAILGRWVLEWVLGLEKKGESAA